jgi:hypothetical protein
MEIPTTEIIEGLLLSPSAIAPDAIEVIEAQAREILDLQATICRLKDEMSAMGELSSGDFWAKRRMAAWRALPEPRPVWERFKRTWKDT